MHDLFGLADYFPQFNIFALQAPHSTGMGGYAWYSIQWDNGDKIIEPKEVAAAGASVKAQYELIHQEHGLTGPTVLGGFSQGAILSAQVMLHNPEFAQGYLLMSGYLLPQWNEVPAIEAPVLQTHGVQDPVIPFEWAERGAQKLQHLPNYQFESYAMGHSLNEPCLTSIQKFLGHWGNDASNK